MCITSTGLNLNQWLDQNNAPLLAFRHAFRLLQEVQIRGLSYLPRLLRKISTYDVRAEHAEHTDPKQELKCPALVG
jgi:hypothetical protein